MDPKAATATDVEDPPGWRQPSAVSGPETRTDDAVNRSEYVAETLAHMAEAGEPGQRLGTKVTLRKLCGVSVGTFNEGTKVAQSRGYITSRSGPGGGIFIARPSPIVRLSNSVLALDREAASVDDAVRMRDALDPLLVEDLAWHSSTVDVRDLHGHVRVMGEAIEAGDAVAFVRANWDMQARIARISPNAILRSVYLSLLEIINSHALHVSVENGQLPQHAARSFALARHLIEAVQARDPEAATRLILEHNQIDT